MTPGINTGFSHQAVPPLPSSLHFCLPSVSLSLPFRHHLLAPLRGTWALWVSGVFSGVVSGVLFRILALWYQTRVISGIVSPDPTPKPGGHLKLAPCPDPMEQV